MELNFRYLIMILHWMVLNYSENPGYSQDYYLKVYFNQSIYINQTLSFSMVLAIGFLKETLRSLCVINMLIGI